MEEKNTSQSQPKNAYGVISAVFALIFLILGFLLGWYIKSKKQTVLEMQCQAKLDALSQKISDECKFYKQVVDMTYPKPPEEMREVSGTVKEKGENFIVVTTRDPDDYLPHPDNSPRKTIDRKVLVDSKTSITLIDYSKLAKGGQIVTTKIPLSKIEVGSAVVVRSKTNIRNEREFTASEIVTSKL